jgi:hypothetical protein
MPVVSIHQSQYIPWFPYFKKIAMSDIFVVMDNVQFQKNGVQNRNKIRNYDGDFWLTIPVTGNRSPLRIQRRHTGLAIKNGLSNSIKRTIRRCTR